ncbi:MAG: hypothetical protein WBD99_15725 [Thermodesulfobacteriota bacterium]
MMHDARWERRKTGDRVQETGDRSQKTESRKQGCMMHDPGCRMQDKAISTERPNPTTAYINNDR